MTIGSLFTSIRPCAWPTLATALLFAGAAAAQQELPTGAEVETGIGEMYAEFTDPGRSQEMVESIEAIRFEPWQMLEELFFRNDVVWLMRHGPTDWSKLDIKNVSPTDCFNQRIQSPDGEEDMAALGQILAFNGVLPGEIKVSEWCRNQQTVENFLEGIAKVNPDFAEGIEVETVPDLNLLYSLQGAATVTPMREMIASWDGDGAHGPLLLVSHYTNIEELTDFRIYEGEALVIDPKRDNRVIGYFRLRSAGPDLLGHFRID